MSRPRAGGAGGDNALVAARVPANLRHGEALRAQKRGDADRLIVSDFESDEPAGRHEAIEVGRDCR